MKKLIIIFTLIIASLTTFAQSQCGVMTINPATGKLDCIGTGGSGGGGAWGSITGTITNQTDLMTLLSGYAQLSGATMTGALILAADPTTALGAATKQYIDNKLLNYTPTSGISNGPGINFAYPPGGIEIINGGVLTFNTRGGDITLTNSDVTTALGYTPYNSTNPSGYITSTGICANVTGTVAIANGGTGQITAQAAINALFGGTTTNGLYARGNGTNIVMGSIQAADVPTLNQNTTGTAANITASSNSTLTSCPNLVISSSKITPKTYSSTAYTGSTVTVDALSGNTSITGVTGAQTIAYSNLSDGGNCEFQINKTTSSNIAITLPSNTYFISETIEATISGLVVTLTGTSGSSYQFRVLDQNGFLQTRITKMASDQIYSTAKLIYASNTAVPFSGSASSDVVLFSVVLPASTLGTNSTMKITYDWSVFSGSSSTSYTFKIWDSSSSSSGLWSSDFTSGTTASTNSKILNVRNNNATNSQKAIQVGGTTYKTTAIDMTTQRTINFSINVSSTANYTQAPQWEAVSIEIIN